MERTELRAQDGVILTADYYPGSLSRGALLVHMMPADRTSWRDFALQLQKENYHLLAIDLRGHGESSGGPSEYQNFSDEEHQKSILDLVAGAEFLRGKGVENLSLVGASIGANLVLQFIAEHSEVKNGVLLSPGLNYRGIEAMLLMAKLQPGQRVLLVGSENDPQSKSAVLHTLSSNAAEGVASRVILYKHAGHGTDMLGKESPDLAEEILNWLK